MLNFEKNTSDTSGIVMVLAILCRIEQVAINLHAAVGSILTLPCITCHLLFNCPNPLSITLLVFLCELKIEKLYNNHKID